MNNWSGPHTVEISGHTVVVPASDEAYRWAFSPEANDDRRETTLQRWLRVLGIEVRKSVEADGFEATLRNTLDKVRQSAYARQDAAAEYERRVGELHALFGMLGKDGSITIAPASGQTLVIETNGRDSLSQRYIELDDSQAFKAKSLTVNSQEWKVHLWDTAESGIGGSNMISINVGDRPTEFRVLDVDLRSVSEAG